MAYRAHDLPRLNFLTWKKQADATICFSLFPNFFLWISYLAVTERIVRVAYFNCRECGTISEFNFIVLTDVLILLNRGILDSEYKNELGSLSLNQIWRLYKQTLWLIYPYMETVVSPLWCSFLTQGKTTSTYAGNLEGKRFSDTLSISLVANKISFSYRI